MLRDAVIFRPSRIRWSVKVNAENDIILKSRQASTLYTLENF